MGRLGLLKLLLQLATGLVGYLGKRQLIEAGEARAIRKGLEDVLENVDKARHAARAARRGGAWADGVRDKYTRDD